MAPRASEQTSDNLALSERLRPVLLRLARELRREARAVGVSPSHVSLLGEIKYSPGIGVNELAERERMSPAAMSGHVEKLVAAGFVLRTPSDRDRRRVGLTLTDEGRRVLRNVRSRRTVWLARRLSMLSTEERVALEQAVEPLARVLGEERR
jgi:DNA-binding MarR family transcriptional regulator